MAGNVNQINSLYILQNPISGLLPSTDQKHWKIGKYSAKNLHQNVKNAHQIDTLYKMMLF